MQFKEWLLEGEYGTSAAGPVGPGKVGPDGVVDPGNLNNGAEGRSKYQMSGSAKRSRPMPYLDMQRRAKK